MNTGQIGIIGAGASGLMAAVSAAWTGKIAAGEIVLMEQQERIGQKILVTGNGKCNLSNRDCSPHTLQDYYRGARAGELERFFTRYSAEDARACFRRMGVLLTARNGYIYPLSGQASTVLDAFRFELERLGVSVRTGCRVLRVRRERGGFMVETEQENLHFRSLILSCGTPAGRKRGEGTDGYRIAASFGHTVLGPWPALVQLRCAGDYWKGLAGVRCAAGITLYAGERDDEVWQERGELLITDYGLSGIPVFQLSRFASRALAEGRPVRALVDFLPGFEEENGDWEDFCAGRFDGFAGRRAEVFFAGLGNKKLLMTALKKNGLGPQDPITQKTRRQAEGVFRSLRRWEVAVVGTNPFSNAQVCAGGIPLREISDDMESLRARGLYLTGELLDVDGKCGGYNLQWAWTSGTIAGRQAAAACGRRP